MARSDDLDMERVPLSTPDSPGADAPPGRPARTRARLLALSAAALGAALVLAAVSARAGLGRARGRPAVSAGLEVGRKAEVAQIEVVPSREDCARPQDNCLWSREKCCRVTGQRCYLKTPYEGFCNETCTREPGDDDAKCGQSPDSIHMAPVVDEPHTSLYCFSVYTHDTGSAEKSWELDLLKTQLSMGASIFGCQDWGVFSDVEALLSPGPPTRLTTTQVFDVEGEFKALRRDNGNGYVNTPFFYQVWKQIRKEGRWLLKDWTVKVDPDCVFLPQRLVGHLRAQGVTEHGVYFENCKDVDSGFFGSLEVLSKKAFNVLVDNLEDCKLHLCWKGGCGWKWGPWGEDLFAQRCMDRHRVEKVEDFGLTTDGACPADRPPAQRANKKWRPDCATVLTPAMHPFKDPESYFGCLSEIMKP